MAATYSGNPSSSGRDQVRFLVGDTVDLTTDAKLTDGEIDFLLDEWGTPYLAAAAGADHLAATAASWLTYSADGQSMTLSEAQQKYYTLAENLRVQNSRRYRAAPYVGGMELSDVEAHESDDSVVHTDFGTGMHDNGQSGSLGGATRRDLLGGPW